MKGVDTEPSQVAKGKAEVEFFIFEQNLLLVFVQNGENQGFNRFFGRVPRRR